MDIHTYRKTESESGVDIKTEMQAKKRDTLTRLRHAHFPLSHSTSVP